MKTATDARGLTFVQVSELCFLSITLVYARMHFLKIIKEKTIPQSLERATLFGVRLYSPVLRGNHLLRSSLPTSTVLSPFPTCHHPVTPKPSSNFSGVHTLNPTPFTATLTPQMCLVCTCFINSFSHLILCNKHFL